MKTLDSLSDEELIHRAIERYYAQAAEAGVYAPEVSLVDSYVTRSGWIILRNTFRELARLRIETLAKNRRRQPEQHSTL